MKILVALLVLVVLAATAWFLFAFAMTRGQPGGPGGPATSVPKESGSWQQSHRQSGLVATEPNSATPGCSGAWQKRTGSRCALPPRVPTDDGG